MRSISRCFVFMVFGSSLAMAQEASPPFQQDFPAAELQQRRERIYDAIGRSAVAIVQGAPAAAGFTVFRQSNDLYYLCGVETPHAYLFLDGRNRRSTLFLPHRNEALERSVGRSWSAEDETPLKGLTGLEAIAPIEMLSRLMNNTVMRPPGPTVFTPFSPAEGSAQSRDELLSHQASIYADPWDGAPPREARFIDLLRSRYPSLELRDLTPVLDTLRFIKSEREIALIRKASVLAGLGLMEAMKSTRPGIFEYQAAAAARFIFLANGARFESYNPIAAGGTNAWMGHYSQNGDALKSGDMILMDYAPELRYYVSDVTRMWPVNGRFTADQRALATFILEYRNAFFRHIKPGVTPDDVLAAVRKEMEPILARTKLTKEIYRKAAEAMFTFRGHIQHPVGMTVHDVGTVWKGPFREGMVFTIDPMMWIPEERLYVRMEDCIVVTRDGIENFTDFMPSTPEEIEKLMREEGVLQKAYRLEDHVR